MLSTGHSVAEDVDCHSIAGTVDATGTDCAEGTDHDSTDWVINDTSAGGLTKGWCVDECCFLRPIPEASSS